MGGPGTGGTGAPGAQGALRRGRKPNTRLFRPLPAAPPLIRAIWRLTGQRGWHLADLATASGVPLRTLERWRAGAPPRLDTLGRVLDALDCELIPIPRLGARDGGEHGR